MNAIFMGKASSVSCLSHLELCHCAPVERSCSSGSAGRMTFKPIVELWTDPSCRALADRTCKGYEVTLGTERSEATGDAVLCHTYTYSFRYKRVFPY
jgi:hypothetical protein